MAISSASLSTMTFKVMELKELIILLCGLTMLMIQTEFV
ncbi:hypothetical protein PGTDC60_1179 [Porphyromonas gingivalis TDC60]|nr:hypothetical protein PGTDC60_1179 [Porphyromonas gingivalis TDC60]